MRPPTDTDGQRRAPARPAVVRLAALAVIGLGTIWVPAAASAAAPESRGPKGPPRSCSQGDSRDRDGDHRLRRDRGPDARFRSAALDPGAGSGRDAGDGCADAGRGGSASAPDGPGSPDRPPPSGGGEHRAPGPPPGGGSGATRTDPAPGGGRGASPPGERGLSQPADGGGSGAAVGRSAAHSGRDANPGGGANGGGANGAGADADAANGRGTGASTGRSGRGAGSTGGPPGNARRAAGGGRRGGAGADDLRPVEPGVPPRQGDQTDTGFGGPRISWTSLRAPGVSLGPDRGIPGLGGAASSVAAIADAASRTATAAAAAARPIGPLPRTGGEVSASTVLALVLLVGGRLLRIRTSGRDVAGVEPAGQGRSPTERR